MNPLTFGFQYWNNLITSTISAPLVTFPACLLRHQHQRSPAVVPAQVAVQGRLLQDHRQAHLQGGVDYIWNPVEGGFFEFSSTLEFDFAVDPSVILSVSNLQVDLKPAGVRDSRPGQVMSQANGNPYFLVATKQLGLYIQDDWKVHPAA